MKYFHDSEPGALPVWVEFLWVAVAGSISIAGFFGIVLLFGETGMIMLCVLAVSGGIGLAAAVVRGRND